MSIERNPEGFNEDLSAVYDYPTGEVPAIPIGQFSHVELSNNGDGTVSVSKKSYAEIQEVRDVASEVGAEIIDAPNGAHNSTVIRHKAFIWIGGVIGVAMGLTATGIGTTFAIEHHKRKHRK